MVLNLQKNLFLRGAFSGEEYMKKIVKPCHMFNYQGRWYVINIEGMFAKEIDDKMVGVIKNLTVDPALVLDAHIEEKLTKLGLLSEEVGECKKDIKEEIPISNMALFLTQSCNLKCVYCYGEGGCYGTGGTMKEETAIQAVDWLIEQSGTQKDVHIGFFGGEPLLKFSLMKLIVEYGSRRFKETGKKLNFYITTNGTLLDDEKIAFLAEHSIEVMVSFDGTKELQDSQRPYINGEGSYDSAVPGIKKLLEILPESIGHSVIVGNTDPEIVKDSMEEIGFKHISIMPASRSLFADETVKTKSSRDTRSLLQGMEEEAEKWVSLIRKRDSEALKDFKNRSGLNYALLSLFHNSKRYHACGAGLGLVAVSFSGDVYLCHRFVGREEYKLGSVFEKELKREEYQKSPLSTSKLCSSCFARYYCAGGCKHDNAGSCGSVSKPSEDMCRMRCRELELAASIICRLDVEDRIFLIDNEIVPINPCPFDFL